MASSSSRLYPAPFVDSKEPVPKIPLRDVLVNLKLIIPETVSAVATDMDEWDAQRQLELPTVLRARALTLVSCFGEMGYMRMFKIGSTVISHVLMQGNIPTLNLEDLLKANAVAVVEAKSKAQKLYVAGHKDYKDLAELRLFGRTPPTAELSERLAKWRYAITIAKQLMYEMDLRLEEHSETEESTEEEILGRIEKWLKLVIERIKDHPELANEFRHGGSERTWAMDLLEKQRGVAVKIVFNPNTSQEDLEITTMLDKVLIDVTDSDSPEETGGFI